MTVSIDDLWRFALKTRWNKSGLAKVTEEIRSRIPNAPRSFIVHFRPDEHWRKTLERIVRTVKPYQLTGITKKELQQEALAHVEQKVLPNLWLAKSKRGWVAYITQSVRNFYKD